MKGKLGSLVTLGVTLVLIVAVGLLALNGIQVGKYIFKSVPQAIRLGLDLRGGAYAVYLGDTSAPDFDHQMDATIEVMRNRLTGSGFTEATITRQGTDRIRVEIPDVNDPDAIMEILGKPAHLTFVDPDGNIVIEGKDIINAVPALSQDGGNTPLVQFELSADGATRFRDATSKYLNQVISIELDGSVISAPTVQSVIANGQGVITGSGSIEEAITLANLILSGALPLDLTIDEASAVSATLGVDAISTSVTAGIVGLALVMLFMLIRYRLPGLMANMALCIYILIVFYALALVPDVQLTLPGIAGILLGVGMAVDANVLIFERFREELRAGRALSSAVERGFKNALTAIIDSNVTTLMAGFVLMYYGTGPIKGFAITLVIGVIASMFTAVVVTRFLLRRVVRLMPDKVALYAPEMKDTAAEAAAKKPIFTHKPSRFAVLSLAVMAVAVVMSLFGSGLNAGIEFTGGALLRYEMGEDFDVSIVEDTLVSLGVTESQIAKAGRDEVKTQLQIRMRDMGNEGIQFRADLEAQLKETYPNLTYIDHTSVGAVAGRDLIRNAVSACLIVFALLLVYIAIRFDLHSGLAVLVGLLHDVAIMIAFMVFFRNMYQVNSPFIAAILTIIGYSINNTIVIFDRIRENVKSARFRGAPRTELVEHSIRSTLARSLNTTLTTLIMLVALYALGVTSIREFIFPLIVGMLTGVYSSLMLSGQLWAFWQERDAFSGMKRWFRRGKTGPKKA